MPSFQSGTECFSTALLANRATAARQEGLIVIQGTNSYTTVVQLVTDTAITYRFERINATTGNIVKVVPTVPMTCGKIDTTDMLELSWMIVLAWLGVYGIKLAANAIQSMLQGETL